jgi:hypothetical protein
MFLSWRSENACVWPVSASMATPMMRVRARKSGLSSEFAVFPLIQTRNTESRGGRNGKKELGKSS